MEQPFDDQSDWESLRRFKALNTDAERMEQMFMAQLASTRTSRENSHVLQDLRTAVKIQNGRVGKLETRWIQGAAVIAFLLVVIPFLLAAASLLTR